MIIFILAHPCHLASTVDYATRTHTCSVIWALIIKLTAELGEAKKSTKYSLQANPHDGYYGSLLKNTWDCCWYQSTRSLHTHTHTHTHTYIYIYIYIYMCVCVQEHNIICSYVHTCSLLTQTNTWRGHQDSWRTVLDLHDMNKRGLLIMTKHVCKELVSSFGQNTCIYKFREHAHHPNYEAILYQGYFLFVCACGYELFVCECVTYFT
jgi:hypothetical protein